MAAFYNLAGAKGWKTIKGKHEDAGIGTNPLRPTGPHPAEALHLYLTGDGDGAAESIDYDVQLAAITYVMQVIVLMSNNTHNDTIASRLVVLRGVDGNLNRLDDKSKRRVMDAIEAILDMGRLFVRDFDAFETSGVGTKVKTLNRSNGAAIVFLRVVSNVISEAGYDVADGPYESNFNIVGAAFVNMFSDSTAFLGIWETYGDTSTNEQAQQLNTATSATKAASANVKARAAEKARVRDAKKAASTEVKAVAKRAKKAKRAKAKKVRQKASKARTNAAEEGKLAEQARLAENTRAQNVGRDERAARRAQNVGRDERAARRAQNVGRDERAARRAQNVGRDERAARRAREELQARFASNKQPVSEFMPTDVLDAPSDATAVRVWTDGEGSDESKSADSGPGSDTPMSTGRHMTTVGDIDSAPPSRFHDGFNWVTRVVTGTRLPVSDSNRASPVDFPGGSGTDDSDGNSDDEVPKRARTKPIGRYGRARARPPMSTTTRTPKKGGKSVSLLEQFGISSSSSTKSNYRASDTFDFDSSVSSSDGSDSGRRTRKPKSVPVVVKPTNPQRRGRSHVSTTTRTQKKGGKSVSLLEQFGISSSSSTKSVPVAVKQTKSQRRGRVRMAAKPTNPQRRGRSHVSTTAHTPNGGGKSVSLLEQFGIKSTRTTNEVVELGSDSSSDSDNAGNGSLTLLGAGDKINSGSRRGHSSHQFLAKYPSDGVKAVEPFVQDRAGLTTTMGNRHEPARWLIPSGKKKQLVKPGDLTSIPRPFDKLWVRGLEAAASMYGHDLMEAAGQYTGAIPDDMLLAALMAIEVRMAKEAARPVVWYAGTDHEPSVFVAAVEREMRKHSDNVSGIYAPESGEAPTKRPTLQFLTRVTELVLKPVPKTPMHGVLRLVLVGYSELNMDTNEHLRQHIKSITYQAMKHGTVTVILVVGADTGHDTQTQANNMVAADERIQHTATLFGGNDDALSRIILVPRLLTNSMVASAMNFLEALILLNTAAQLDPYIAIALATQFKTTGSNFFRDSDKVSQFVASMFTHHKNTGVGGSSWTWVQRVAYLANSSLSKKIDDTQFHALSQEASTES